jgi:23S rRNA pseudouridine955/2504/2580 synthase
MKEIYIVKNDYSNTRLDRWIRRNIREVPQSLIEKNLRKGKIKVNFKKVKSSYKLRKNDQVILYDIVFSTLKKTRFKDFYKPTKKDLSHSSNIFIENNENFAVINKPAGIAVQAGTKSKRNILDILKSTSEFEGTYPYPVHRIDKETTGVLIVAKNRKYAQLFTSLFRIRKIHKTYLCIALGKLNKDKGTFIDDLFHYEGDSKIKTKAITHFKVLDTNNNYSLLKLNPQTGRKHQLRKQLLIHGCSVLGDNKYRIFAGKTNKKNLLMLHAYKINFSIAGSKYSFSAELPFSFKNILKEKYLKIS